MVFSTPAWDQAVFTFVNQTLHSDVLNLLLPVFSETWIFWTLGILMFGIGLVRAGWSSCRKLLTGCLLLLIVVSVTDLTCNYIKNATGRVRPLNAVPHTYFVEDGQWRQRPAAFEQTKPRGSSYISAHAANAMAVYVLISLLWKGLYRIWPVPLLVGISRLYLGKHFASDVLAGWLVGLGIALVVYYVWEQRLWDDRIPMKGELNQ